MNSENFSEQYRLMRDGKSYHFDEYLYSLQAECSRKIQLLNNTPYGSPEREEMFRELFDKYGNNNIIKEGFICNFGSNISIGNGCFINHRVTILDSFKVIIGNNVFIAPNVVISAVTHPIESQKRRELIIKPIVIEDDVWIGANSVILPGVTIHKGAVIGACSLVKKDVATNTVVGGVPAKVLKTINQ